MKKETCNIRKNKHTTDTSSFNVISITKRIGASPKWLSSFLVANDRGAKDQGLYNTNDDGDNNNNSDCIQR